MKWEEKYTAYGVVPTLDMVSNGKKITEIPDMPIRKKKKRRKKQNLPQKKVEASRILASKKQGKKIPGSMNSVSSSYKLRYISGPITFVPGGTGRPK